MFLPMSGHGNERNPFTHFHTRLELGGPRTWLKLLNSRARGGTAGKPRGAVRFSPTFFAPARSLFSGSSGRPTSRPRCQPTTRFVVEVWKAASGRRTWMGGVRP
jgi:hypothetical protein